MKKLFIILFFLPLCFFSQNEEEYLIKKIHSLSHKDPNWKKLESKITWEEKIKLITPLFFDDSEQYCKGDSITNPQQFLKHYASVFHFIDLDKDKDIDLVFSGIECAASEVGKVNIYINKDNKLEKTFSDYGKISEFCSNKHFTINRQIRNAATATSLSYVSIAPNNVQLKATILYYSYMPKAVATILVPSKLKAGKTISLKLSTALFLAAEEKDLFNIAKTKDEAFGIIYGSYIDNRKQKWLFTKFPYSDIILQNTVTVADAGKACFLGWIKAPK